MKALTLMPRALAARRTCFASRSSREIVVLMMHLHNLPSSMHQWYQHVIRSGPKATLAHRVVTFLSPFRRHPGKPCGHHRRGIQFGRADDLGRRGFGRHRPPVGCRYGLVGNRRCQLAVVFRGLYEPAVANHQMAGTWRDRDLLRGESQCNPDLMSG